LNSMDNTTDGATGLPLIAATENLTMVGDGDTVERNAALGTPAFRLFDVAAGGSLTLENLALQGGLAFGYGAAAQGGAVYNQGTLILNGVTVQNNTAQGRDGGFPDPRGQDAAGGGIYSAGSLIVQGCIVQTNQAVGGHGGRGPFDSVGWGG